MEACTPVTADELFHLTGVHVYDPTKYLSALTHKSCARQEFRNYERLEFLGDAIINLIATRFTFNHMPDANVGELTQVRSRLVSGKCLTILARHIGIERHIRVSVKAAQRCVNQRDRICEDVFEALVGAMYTDVGFGACEAMVMRLYKETDMLAFAVQNNNNFKDVLNRCAHARFKAVPHYTSSLAQGVFVSHVCVNGVAYGVGRGCTKKEAEQEAARIAVCEIIGSAEPNH